MGIHHFKPIFNWNTKFFYSYRNYSTCWCSHNLGPPCDPQCNICVINNNSTPYNPQIIFNVAVVNQSTLYLTLLFNHHSHHTLQTICIVVRDQSCEPVILSMCIMGGAKLCMRKYIWALLPGFRIQCIRIWHPQSNSRM